MHRTDLEASLTEYTATDAYPFHMPGHKRRHFHGAEGPEGEGSPLDRAAEIDITEIDGFDNLHAPEGLLLEEMQLAARLYGTRETYFSVNGSTGALLAAISAAVPRGGTILMERTCHISVYHAASLRDLRLKFVPDGEAVDAVILTSPSYEGWVKEVEDWAAYAHERGGVLIVDEAHGAHFSGHPYFPVSSIHRGADLVIQSTHKTLPALTQTALLHNVTGRVEGRRLRSFLSVYETSSPSYLLMASISRCIHGMAEEGPAYFASYACRLRELRERLSGLRHLRLAGSAEEVERGLYDPGKLLICSGRAGWGGTWLYETLRDRWHLQPEMKGLDCVLLMTSPADTEEGFRRLEEALKVMDAELGEREVTEGAEECPRPKAFSPAVSPRTAMTLAEALEAPLEWVPLEEAGGRVSGEYLLVYPPDAPLILPGEIFTEALMGEMHALLRAGLHITGFQRGSGTGNSPRVAVLAQSPFAMHR